MEDYIIRTKYLEKISEFKETDLIKIITGVRRCGKSVLMEQFQDRLKDGGIKSEQIISVNFEKLENEELLDYKKLHSYLAERLNKSGWTYLFLDEIQMVPEFQKAINSLRTKKQVDIYITGSNSSLLGGELATLLTGRYITIHVLPLSFKEYVSAHTNKFKSKYENFNPMRLTEKEASAMYKFIDDAVDGDPKRLFQKYIKLGAFPQTIHLSSEKGIFDYLDDVLSAIIRKDILARGKSVQESILMSITKFIFHSIGCEISSVNITNTLKSNKREVSYNTVEKYLCYLKESFIIYEAGRYDVKGKQHLKQNAKYYAVDIGLRNMLLANKETDIGYVLENIIYLELLRRGYKVSVGKIDNQEVDFVAENEQGIEYYQVSASILDAKTRDRELEPLNSIKDHFPKFLITLDDYTANTTYNGIKVINAINFLLND